MKIPPATESTSPLDVGVGGDAVATRAEAAARIVELSTLLDGKDRMYIVHSDRKYCLRITAQNKLILTA